MADTGEAVILGKAQSDLRILLRDRVGGFFHNTNFVPGLSCAVCRGPADRHLCPQCQQQSDQFGPRLADLALTLAYVRGNAPGYHQSAFTMRAYKAQPPSEKAAADLALMVLAATGIHAACAARALGTPWAAVSFVPSATWPGPNHPVAQLARNVWGMAPDQRFLIECGPRLQEEGRTVLADRFVVASGQAERIRGKSVLLVDDTWTSGCKAQSAALAVRTAGAAKVTVLCVARWCRHDWPDHRRLLDRFSEPYDVMHCPVTGGACPS